MYCKNYGKQIPDGAKNCSYCGIDQTYQVICERKRQAMIPLRKSTRKDSQGYSAASVLPALKGFIAFMSEKSEQRNPFIFLLSGSLASKRLPMSFILSAGISPIMREGRGLTGIGISLL